MAQVTLLAKPIVVVIRHPNGTETISIIVIIYRSEDTALWLRCAKEEAKVNAKKI